MNRTLKKWGIWQMLEIFVAANYVRNETYFFHQDSLKAILTSVRTGQAWAACCWPDMTSWTSGQLAGSPRLPSVWPPWRPWRPRARDPGRHDLNFKAYSWQNPPKLCMIKVHWVHNVHCWNCVSSDLKIWIVKIVNCKFTKKILSGKLTNTVSYQIEENT